jgi:alpha-1,2-mannosyltransferase
MQVSSIACAAVGTGPLAARGESGATAGKVSSWVRGGGPAVLTAALLLCLVAYLRWPAYAEQIDVLVYRFGAVRVRDGLDLYSTGFYGSRDVLLFTYTPFAALCFIPLSLFSRLAVQILSLLAMSVLLTYAVQRMLRWFGVTAAHGLWGLTALLVGLLIWLEPVQRSVQLGQINLLILAVVLADLLGRKDRKWAGVGVGLVAGIKLTPAIFIIYLVLMGRLRAAVAATATLATTVLVGFAVLPKDSRYFWTDGYFEDARRISRDPGVSSSLRGLFVRLHYPGALATIVAIVLAVAGLALGVLAWRRGHAMVGIAVVGLASAATSPFSWSHHWVWFAPLVVHLGYRAYVLGGAYAALALWLMCALLGGWITAFEGKTPPMGLITLRPGGIWDAIVPSGYVFVFLAATTATAVWLFRRPSVPRTLEDSPRRAVFPKDLRRTTGGIARRTGPDAEIPTDRQPR